MTHMPAVHLDASEHSKGKYLIIIRDPVQQLQSLRTMEFFMVGHILRLPLDAFITIATETRKTGWADHAHQWWRLRNLPNVKIIFYEDMQHRPLEVVQEVAQFVDVQLNDKQLQLVRERMSKKWALEHVDGQQYQALTPFSPPPFIREKSGSMSHFIVDQSKFFSTDLSEKISSEQESRIRSLAKAKILALDKAQDTTDGANFIQSRPSYFH